MGGVLALIMAGGRGERLSILTEERSKPAVVKVDHDRVSYWLGKGAQPSDSVRTLIARHLTVKPEPPVATEPAK